MTSRQTSRSALFGLRQKLSMCHLVGAALPLALSSCSSDDHGAVTAQPALASSAPASNAPADVPGSQGPGGANAPTMETGTPAASASTDGQQVVNRAASEGQAADTALAPGGGAAGAAGVAPSGCAGEAWPTADPTSAGPFQVSVDKDVGPLAGFLPDPVYGNVQQRFNVYRPSNLDSSGFCHPILVWANGHGDNPEQHPPECIVDPATNTWCGTYPGLINQLASHGFVVIASLSTTTSRGEPLPTITGLDWLLQQAEDATSPYFHHLDTAHIGALGHSEGGASTCMAAADPRISAIATVSGTRPLTGLHGPALLICGGQDTTVPCAGVNSTFSAVTDQPAMFMDNLAADHGSWLGQNGSKGPDFFALTAWFRVHLMDDQANRQFFFGPDCTLCTDTRVTIQRNDLMTQ
jgi:hypothetical protein